MIFNLVKLIGIDYFYLIAFFKIIFYCGMVFPLKVKTYWDDGYF